MSEPIDWRMHAKSVRAMAIRIRLQGDFDGSRRLLKAADEMENRAALTPVSAQDAADGQRATAPPKVNAQKPFAEGATQ